MINYIAECKKQIDQAVDRMNDKFFGANWKQVKECVDNMVLAQVEINRALHKAEKYRWHDLRKCPDDLPKEEGLVLVSLNGYHNKSTYDHAIDMVYWVCDGKFYDDMGMNVMVEAWKEIETFEEDSE